MENSPPSERRQDLHRQALIEVGIRLQRHFGTAYAEQYLADVNIPELTIQRILSRGELRKPPARGCGYDAPPTAANDEH
ncbi:hypothetical protein [Massilia sp. ST3]|uniref:hypothetical protein n=1 Tax=Massilia sp. ST3 TaxID=2824903 RepID=UPI001B824E71|nr:hypothetical protein [Massilia sp. ST3]MBQ5948436.1 hypothetical protein [Massilia sp. ST3]